MTKVVPLDLNDARQAEISRRLEAHYREAYGDAGERLRATGLDLKGKLLDNVYLGSAFLIGCSFEQASLREADLSSTEMGECSFRCADMRGASFVKALVYECDFRDSNMAECNLIKWGVDNCDFRHATLRGAQMLGFGGHDCDFRDADLGDVTFSSTTFRGSLVAGMNLTGVSGTLQRPQHVINVGTPEEPHLLRDEEVLEWFRSVGARVEWFLPPGLPPRTPPGE
jgi:uncharacterized protein YjbI with pentapeptide repeats